MKQDTRNIPLKGPQKAAAFMLSLEETTVAKILSFLEQDEVHDLSKAMANLGVVEATTIENIYEDFRKDIAAGTGTIVGSIEKTEKLLTQIFPPEKVEESSAEIRPVDAVYDVPVVVTAILGSAKMPVNELLKLSKGSVVELDRHIGDPVDIYVNNRLVAKGEVVSVDDKLAITMTDVIKILK